MNRTPCTELVIFDCDGVLIDSEIISSRVLIRLLGDVGVHVDHAHVQRHFLGRSWPKVAAEIRIQYGLTLGTEFEERYRSDLLAAFETELRPVDGVEAVIAGLGVKSCVATSSSPKRARRSLELAGLAASFGEHVFTASQVANGKPAPDLFLYAAQSMGVAPEACLVIEDSRPGVEAARAAGMPVWRFIGASHMRGLDIAGPDDADGIRHFSRWAEFFELEPYLRGPAAGAKAHG
ncbi:HAD superfamily hydrolase (TIGR01509 family) [Hoeflea marina]|uniref:HAD superfamily hydrolase (TIGR01509 family) n=1 Tax=Hoeflea marina TaxID=274592 RepID=A0A317PTB2_9HYPH|nr:HAD family hydrolase [Hoeflea marina]PWW02054.1 HAD superfamily hydrolase (TIGR01509 family) [Hoeflea marina]